MGRSPDRDRRRPSRSRSRSRDRDSSHRSSSRRSRSRSRSRSHSRDRSDRTGGGGGGRSDVYRSDPRDRDSRNYGPPRGGGGAGYRPQHQQQQPPFHGQSRFGDARATPSQPQHSHSQQQQQQPASYGYVAPAQPASAASADGGKNDSFLKFQQALQLHNAARLSPAVAVPQQSAAKQAATVAYYSSRPDQSSSSDTHSTATASTAKAVALASLEELARKKAADEAADVAAIKPVFLSKAERQAAALAKLAAQQAEAQNARAKQEAHMKSFLDAAAREKQEQREAAVRAQRKAAEDRERKRAEDAQRRISGAGGAGGGGGGGGTPALAVHANNLSSASELEKGRERELELIRNHYLGVKDPSLKKVHIPSTQRFKFNFDWSAKDDTSVDTNALYKHKHEVVAMYGRGFQGGVDRREAKKKNSFYEELARDRIASGAIGSSGVEEPQPESTEMDQRRRAGQAIKDEPVAMDEGPDDHAAMAAAASVSSSLAAASSAAAAQARLERMRARAEHDARREAELERRQRHWRMKGLNEMEERDWRIMKEDFSISCRGSKVPNPLRFWNEANLPDALMRALEQAGYKDPTPIQRAAIPIGLQCRDVVGIAETGSGKTCAFLVPMLVYISKQPTITQSTATEGPYSLIMAPTRELAQQISVECDKFSKYMRIRNVCAVGGLDKEAQGSLLAQGVEVLIGTPGRLYDLIQSRLLVLNRCNYIVLDEADRMIDEGFGAQIQAVMDHMPSTNLRPADEELEDPAVAQQAQANLANSMEAMQARYMAEQQAIIDGQDPVAAGAAAASAYVASASAASASARVYRQTILFSATMPPAVETLAKTYLRNPVHISVGDRDKAASRVVQRLEWMTSESAKKPRLLELVSQSEMPLIIFANLKQHCDSIHRWLSGMGLASAVLHGSKSQPDRSAAIAAFRDKKVPILVATDVAGRGLDVSGVMHVINYELPAGPDPDKCIDTYIHRIGRTGRAGLSGLATSFVGEGDTDIMYALTNLLKESGHAAAIPPQMAQQEASKFSPAQIIANGGPSKKDKVQYSSR